MLESKMEESYEEMLFRYGITCAENLVMQGKKKLKFSLHHSMI